MTVQVSVVSPGAVEADVLAVPVVEPGEPPGNGVLDDRLRRRLADLVAAGEVSGELGESCLLHVEDGAGPARVAAAGLGPRGSVDPDAIRTAAASVARAASRFGGSVAWLLDPSLDLAPTEQARAVVEATGALAELGLPLEVVSVVAACENLTGGGAYRPGDILTAMNGKTIEVINTDAEGRLVLADALWYAHREGATHLLDLATLTGTIERALGDLYAGVFANDDEWRPRGGAAAGRRLAAFGLTEPDAGSDAGATRTRAELRNGSWVVNGSKIFITNAGTDITACVTITARTGEDEISNLIVPNGTPGYEISKPMKKLGWRASDTRELSFKDCAVPEANLLGPRGQGFQQFLEILDGGRISVAAMGVGLAQGAYDLAFAYAQERRQFGRPIASFQAISFKLADMAVEIEAGRQLVYRAAWQKDQGRDFALAAAQAKLYTGELSHRVVNAALQIHGGYGFMEEFAISRLFRDQKILEIGEGTNEVQRMVIARHLGL